MPDTNCTIRHVFFTGERGRDEKVTLKGGHVVRTKWPIGESARRRSGQRLRAATLSVGQRARELQRLGRVSQREAHRTPLSPCEYMQNGSTTYIDVDDGQRDGQGRGKK